MPKGPIKLAYGYNGLNVSDAIKIKPNPFNNVVLKIFNIKQLFHYYNNPPIKGSVNWGVEKFFATILTKYFLWMLE